MIIYKVLITWYKLRAGAFDCVSVDNWHNLHSIQKKEGENERKEERKVNYIPLPTFVVQPPLPLLVLTFLSHSFFLPISTIHDHSGDEALREEGHDSRVGDVQRRDLEGLKH